MQLTQQDIYEKLDISQNHYSRIKNGHMGMSLEILVQLSDILHVSADYILTGDVAEEKYPDFAVKYNKLSEKQKKFIINQIDDLAKLDLK